MSAFDDPTRVPYIEPYQPPGAVSSSRRGQLPGDLEPQPGMERYVENMKKSPLPITWGGMAGAIGGTLVGGVYGGVAGVALGLYLERKWQKE
mmetsp:Transcript_59550/g.141705  ORF Transcript_59550/g.141705 Transcript_59550/m.141705 type:complete len:92 (-) Transcript_59550:263-538(-)|eukprot:CAMPEP_0178402318 /NCGR_PEP_ID=MMETSP0689_2-20121128/16776_1 /TAXON_ID=160604 /ORGANISM="Amphidinium massartii, Strain CS-259" /LENGTH=91 /DNA_ID=CAMNT_0020023207 /DNA_START=61 /DNA_END=336 /DNA_ORIENTATION=+